MRIRRILYIALLLTFMIVGCDKPAKKTTPKKIRSEVPTQEKIIPDQKQQEKAAEEKPALPIPSGKTRKELAEEKISQVRKLFAALKQKRENLKEDMDKINAEIQLSIDDIKAERQKTGLKESDEAIKDINIEASLKAIQKAHAYLDVVTEEIQLVEKSRAEVKGAEKQLRLDILMLTRRDEAEIDRMITDLDLVITRIQPDAQKLIFENKAHTLMPLPEIYDKYILEEERKKEQELEKERQRQRELEQKRDLESKRQEEEQQRKLLEARRQEQERQRLAAIKARQEEEARQKQKIIDEANRIKLAEERAKEAARRQVEREEQQRADAIRRAAEAERQQKAAAARRAAQAEAEIAHVKIISPAYTDYIPGCNRRDTCEVRWSNSDTLVAFVTSQKIIIKEMSQGATSEIERFDHDQYFIDAAWSPDNKKMALLATHYCELERGTKATTLSVWSFDGGRSVYSTDLPCNREMRIISWRGNHILIHTSVVQGIFLDSTEDSPVYIVNPSSNSNQATSPFRAFSVVWKDDKSFFYGQTRTIGLYDLNSRKTVAQLNECPKDADATLYYTFCPSSIKVLRMTYDSNRLAAFVNTKDDNKISVWNTQTLNKVFWFGSDLPDFFWWNAALLYVVPARTLYKVDTVAKKLYELQFTTELPQRYYTDQIRFPNKPHLFIDKGTELPLLHEKTGSARGTVFVKSTKSSNTVAALTCEFNLKNPMIAWQPKSHYALAIDAGQVCMWRVADIN